MVKCIKIEAAGIVLWDLIHGKDQTTLLVIRIKPHKKNLELVEDLHSQKKNAKFQE